MKWKTHTHTCTRQSVTGLPDIIIEVYSYSELLPVRTLPLVEGITLGQTSRLQHITKKCGEYNRLTIKIESNSHINLV